MALEMQRVIKRVAVRSRLNFRLRLGLCSGPVIGGVIGRRKFIYDIWGEAVRIATVLEGRCEPGGIRVSESTYAALRDKYQFRETDRMAIERKGEVRSYYLLGRNTKGAAPARAPSAHKAKLQSPPAAMAVMVLPASTPRRSTNTGILPLEVVPSPNWP